MGWQPGASVTVYVIGNFAEPQVSAIENAYNNWNGRLGAGLTFTFLLVPIAPESPRLPASEWSFANDPACPNNLACTHDGWCPKGYQQLTITHVVTTYTGTGDQLFAHEVGHTFGIDDCAEGDCLSAVTIMNPYEANQPRSPMSPHCCDDKLMWQISGGSYGQSADYCSATFVQGTAKLSPSSGNVATATFQQYPQSGDSIVVGCLGSGDTTSFAVMDNQQNAYNPAPGASTYVPLPPPWSSPAADSFLLSAPQVASSQSQSFEVTCTGTSDSTLIDVFALEYADLGTGNRLDGAGQSNSSVDGELLLSCGNLSTGSVNDLIASLYNYNTIYVPSDSPVSADPQVAVNDLAPTLGTVPPCPGGQGGYCIAQPTSPLQYQPGGMSVYPQNMPPGPYSEAWAAPLCIGNCFNPMSGVSAAFEVIGP